MLLQDIKFPNLESLISRYNEILEEPTFLDTSIISPPILSGKDPSISLINLLYRIQINVKEYKDFMNPLIDYIEKFGELLFDRLLKDYDKLFITIGVCNEIKSLNRRLLMHHSFISDHLEDWESGRRKDASKQIVTSFRLLKKLEKDYIDRLEGFLSKYSKEKNYFDGKSFTDFYYREYPQILRFIKGKRDYKMVEVKSDFINGLLSKFKFKEFSAIRLIIEELKDSKETIILPFPFYRNVFKRFLDENEYHREFYIKYDEFERSRFYELYSFNDEKLIAVALCLTASTQKPFRILTRDTDLIKIFRYLPLIKKKYEGEKYNFTNTCLTLNYIKFDNLVPKNIIFNT